MNKGKELLKERKEAVMMEKEKEKRVREEGVVRERKRKRKTHPGRDAKGMASPQRPKWLPPSTHPRNLMPREFLPQIRDDEDYLRQVKKPSGSKSKSK